MLSILVPRLSQNLPVVVRKVGSKIFELPPSPLAPRGTPQQFNVREGHISRLHQVIGLRIV
jgi:hypothetical protein